MASLDFLYDVDEEHIEYLADIIREKGGITNALKNRKDYSNIEDYVNDIRKELLDFGSNTLWFQEDYPVVLRDVCNKMDVDFSSGDTVEEKESKLLAKVASDLWKKMSVEGRKALIESANESADFFGTGSFTVFAGIFKARGFASYKLSMIIFNSVAKVILGHGVKLGVNAALTRALSFVSGPLGVLMGAWTVVKIMGPAYRVTVPAVICIAALRKMRSE